MSNSALIKAQRILYQTGAYHCSHFGLQKVPNGSKKKCCGNTGEDFVPVCGLTNGPCVGLPQCPRLDIQTKSEAIQKWKEDLKRNTITNPLDYVKS
jgi:hypothetical protein